jgi:transposase
MSDARDHMANLPTDADALRALVLSVMSERDALTAERDDLLQRVERQQLLIWKLNRLQFGQKSERLPEDQRQMAFEDLEQAIAQDQAETEKRDPELRQQRAAKRRSSRGALPAHLPRIEITLTPDDTNCPCCRAAMTMIGEDKSERLDVIPVQYRVIVTRRPKFACRACEGVVVQQAAPPRLIEGGIPTEAMVSHVAVSRYADHQPLYRQSQMMARQGVLLDRATLASWMGYMAAELAPVVARLHQLVLASGRVFADETTVPVLDPGRGRTKQGYFWAVARDDRAWGGSDPPAVVYAYAPGRGYQHAQALLGGYRGILQCDGYRVYKQLAEAAGHDASIKLAFCWSHLRREFYDLAKAGAPIATETLTRIAALYQIETTIRGTSAEQRLAVRRTESRPLVEELHRWFTAQLSRLPGRSTTAEIIRYAMNHWHGLERFLDDGRIELDTNTIERAMRPVKLSAKNSLFAGSDEGAVSWARMASLIETCKLNGVNPETYLAELLTRLVNGWPQSRIDELMPWHWAATPAH